MAVVTRARAATLADRVRGEIRAELARRGVPQAELARDLDKHPMWVSDRLRGAVALTLDDLDAIAEALDMDAITFLASAGAGTPPRRSAETKTFHRPPTRPPGQRATRRPSQRHDRPPTVDGSLRTSRT